MARTINVGPVYPPYQLDDFQTCPLLWDYKKRWAKRDKKNWTAMLIGKAIARGLEAHYKGLEEPYGPAERIVEEQYNPEGADRSLKGVLNLTREGLALGLGTNFALSEVLAVERYFGRTVPDLVGRERDGALMVIDHKVKVTLDEKYREKELEKYNRSNQFFEYAWHVGQEYGEPVERVYAHLIILGPSPEALLHPVAIEPEHLRHWLHGASRDWRDMAAIEKGEEEARARFTACRTDFGLCEMYEACHTFHGQEEAFTALYNRVGSRRHASS